MLTPNVEKEAKGLIEQLARKEFGENYAGVRFEGPYEDEDLDADIYVKKDFSDPREGLRRLANISQEVRKRGWDIPTSWGVNHPSS